MDRVLSARKLLRAARLLVAKPKTLQAIDFTTGLVKRLTKQGVSLPGKNNEAVIERLSDLRQIAQDGLDISELLPKRVKLNEKGTKVLDILERQERRLMPEEKDLAAFVKEFPDKTKEALSKQAAYLARHISDELDVPIDTVNHRLVEDEAFFKKAFAVIEPLLQGVKQEASSALSEQRGEFKARIKAPESSFGKQRREKKSILFFKDLIGCRSVVPSVKDFAAATATVQDEFDILEKKNFFLQEGDYNAINYRLVSHSIVVEYQLMTRVTELEAALS